MHVDTDYILMCIWNLNCLGKTAGFMLPILERLLYRPTHTRVSRVLILTPTRELAIQVRGSLVG